MDKYFMWIHYERLHNNNKAKHNKTVCIFLGIYCIFSKSSLNTIVNILLRFDGFKWNFLNFKLDTLSLSHPKFMASGITVTKSSANKGRPFCKLISNSMHVNLGKTNGRIVIQLRYHRREWVLQSQIMPLKVWWGLVVSPQPDIERIAQGASDLYISIPHSSRAWAVCGPTRRPTFSWWNVQMRSIKPQCCISTNFRLVIKSTCFF